MHHLLLFMEDNRSQKLVEREAKRRRVLRLEGCLPLGRAVCHESCQTDSGHIDQAALAAILSETRAQTLGMMNRHVVEFRAEIREMVDRQACEYQKTLQSMEARNAQLQQEVDALAVDNHVLANHLAQLESKQPFIPMTAPYAEPNGAQEDDRHCETGAFLTDADMVRLSQSSTFHFNSFGPGVDPHLLDCG